MQWPSIRPQSLSYVWPRWVGRPKHHCNQLAEPPSSPTLISPPPPLHCVRLSRNFFTPKSQLTLIHTPGWKWSRLWGRNRRGPDMAARRKSKCITNLSLTLMNCPRPIFQLLSNGAADQMQLLIFINASNARLSELIIWGRSPILVSCKVWIAQGVKSTPI